MTAVFSPERVAGARFAGQQSGRRRVVADIVKVGLHQGHEALWVIGYRRTGKSSCLLEASERWLGDPESATYPVEIDLRAVECRPSLLAAVRAAIESAEWKREMAGRQPLGLSTGDFEGAETIEEIVSRLCRALRSAARGGRARALRPVFLLDEIEALFVCPQAYRDIVRLHLRLRDVPGGGLVIAATPRAQALDDTLPPQYSRLFGALRRLPLLPFDAADQEDFFRRYDIPESDRAALGAAAGGHPYCLQLLGAELYNRGPGMTCGDAVARVVRDETASFAALQDLATLSAPTRAALVSICGDEAAAPPPALTGDVRDDLERLADWGWFVERSAGEVGFRVPADVLAAWIRARLVKSTSVDPPPPPPPPPGDVDLTWLESERECGRHVELFDCLRIVQRRAAAGERTTLELLGLGSKARAHRRVKDLVEHNPVIAVINRGRASRVELTAAFEPFETAILAHPRLGPDWDRTVLPPPLESLDLRKEVPAERRLHDLVGQGPWFDELRRSVVTIDRLDSASCALILGESGTGKELVARAIHESGARSGGPFVPVNTAGFEETLASDALFGHWKGAFHGADTHAAGPFERATRGTVFLDEIGDLPLSLQAKLLRVLQERIVERLGHPPRNEERVRKVDVRIVCATNRDLRDEVEKGRFREDLYFRIKGITTNLPPLRERAADIPWLLLEFFRALDGPAKSRLRSVSGDALAALCGAPWRGNVRELRSVVDRLIARSGVAECVDLAAVRAALRG